MLISESHRPVTKHTIRIAGSMYHLVSDESERTIQAAAARIDAMVHEAMAQSDCYDVSKVLVLIAVRLAAESEMSQLKLFSLIKNHIDQVVI